MSRWKPEPVPVEWHAPINAWVAFMHVRDLSEGSIALRASHLRRFARETALVPFEVTLDDLTTFIGAHSSWSAETSAAMRSSLTMFYRWAFKTKRMPEDIGVDLPRVKTSPGTPRPVPEDDFALAIAATDGRVRLALRLAGELGMRRAEVSQVHVDDLIETEQGHLLRILGKGRKERVIPIGSRLAADLIDHIAAHGRDGYAFPGPSGGHLSPHWLGSLVSKALPPDYTMHKLRHRALTQAYRSSKDILLTSKLAGHSSVATTQQYYVAADYTALRSIVEGISS